MSIADLSPGFPTFAEQASQLMALDLVVTVDTAVANLAGALGAKVWVAVPSVPDWRWTLDGALTPWYPTARVYRQSRPGGWRDVFRTMAADLSASLAGRRNDMMALRAAPVWTRTSPGAPASSSFDGDARAARSRQPASVTGVSR